MVIAKLSNALELMLGMQYHVPSRMYGCVLIIIDVKRSRVVMHHYIRAEDSVQAPGKLVTSTATRPPPNVRETSNPPH